MFDDVTLNDVAYAKRDVTHITSNDIVSLTSSWMTLYGLTSYLYLMTSRRL